MNSETIPCQQLILYVTGEMADEERQKFADHLSACPECRLEYKELAEVWGLLPYEAEELELPAEWKEDVLGAITGSKPTPAPPRPSAPEPRVRSWRLYAKHLAATAAVLLVLGAASWWGLAEMQKQGVQAAIDKLNKGPSEMVKQYSLRSFDVSVPGATGQAWVAQKGESMQLVLQTSGLPALQGEQAYQVWGLKNGQRHNCGTFKVDPQGNGVLTYTMKAAERDFDTIGITLEPDSNGTQPRGKKMLGT